MTKRSYLLNRFSFHYRSLSGNSLQILCLTHPSISVRRHHPKVLTRNDLKQIFRIFFRPEHYKTMHRQIRERKQNRTGIKRRYRMEERKISLNILGCCVLRDTFGMHPDDGGYVVNRYVRFPAPYHWSLPPLFCGRMPR